MARARTLAAADPPEAAPRYPAVEYAPDADAVYVRLRTGRLDRTDHIDDARLVDYDAAGHPLGMEFLGVSHGVDLSGLPEAEALANALVGARITVSA